MPENKESPIMIGGLIGAIISFIVFFVYAIIVSRGY